MLKYFFPHRCFLNSAAKSGRTKLAHAKLADTIRENNLLEKLITDLKDEFDLTPVIGVELEFYLSSNIASSNTAIAALETKINCPVKKEKGRNQFEINLPPTIDIHTYTDHIINKRLEIIKYAKEAGGEADFSSKPYPDDYGNSMHVHLNFLENSEVDKYAVILCHYMQADLAYFLPKAEDYLRLNSKFMAPTHISFGNNNRTVAIRIPASLPRRLEHRLPAASACPLIVIYTILKAIKAGLTDPASITPFAKTYGNAFDPQYQLPLIIKPKS